MNGLQYIEILSQPVPEQFSKKIFNRLTPKFGQLLPMDRRVLVAFKDYDIKSINPHFSNTEDYERIIIVCIKLLRDDSFQPIGSILIPNEKKFTETTYHVLGEAIKMYIFTVHLMGLFVMGTISPPTALYKNIFLHLMKMDSFDSFEGPIRFDVAPFGNIFVHIFNYFTIISNIMNDFKKYKIVWYETDGEDFEETDWLDLWNIFKRNRELSETFSKYSQDEYKEHFFKQNILAIVSNPRNISTPNAQSNIRFLEIFACFMRIFDAGLLLMSNFFETEQGVKDLLNIIATMRFKSMKQQKYIDLDDFNDFIITVNGIIAIFNKLYVKRSDLVSMHSLRLDYMDDFVKFVKATKNHIKINNAQEADGVKLEIDVFDSEAAFLALNNTPDGGCFMIVE